VNRTSERLIALTIAGALALNYPLLQLFDSTRLVLGVPVLFMYLFFVWALLIALAALVLDPPSRRARKDPGEQGPA